MTPPSWTVFSAVFENEVYLGSLDVPMGKEGMSCYNVSRSIFCHLPSISPRR